MWRTLSTPFNKGLLIAILLILSIFPFAIKWNQYQPDWLLVLLLFLIYQNPLKIGIISATLIGLLQDLLSQAMLGSCVVLFVLMAWVMRLFIWQFITGNGVGRLLFMVSLFAVYKFLKITLWWWLYDLAWSAVNYQGVFFSILFNLLFFWLLYKIFVVIHET